ncbi:alpha/beta fold hydrolase [Glaciecola siphonariae]|uniref:Alpha/beta fold hydrolase n=1 Tax=Glaciecola siphonariae TaxID=521012 RepID=A0ABV9LYX9_9ALTE
MFRLTLVLFLKLTTLNLSAGQNILVNGKNLEFEVKGRGDIAVLFDAGALTGMAGWNALWNDLPSDITAYRFSRLGEGNSDACVGQRSSEEHVHEVKSIVDAAQIKKPFIYVGHSLGGATARNYAHSFPNEVLGMLLVDPENPRDIEIIKEIDPLNGPLEIEHIKNQDYKDSDGRWCFLDAIWKKEAANDFDDIGNIPVTLIATTMTFDNPTTIFNSDIGRKRWGDVQKEWVSTFPQGQFVATNKSGHYIQQNEPDLVLSELKKLLERVQSSSGKYVIQGKWHHATKPVVIEFDMDKNEAFVFSYDGASSEGLNILKNIKQVPSESNQWQADMYDGYQDKYVTVNLVNHKNELSIFTKDEQEVLRLSR